MKQYPTLVEEAPTVNVNCDGNVNPIPITQFFEENFAYSTGQLTDAPSGSGTNVSRELV